MIEVVVVLVALFCAGMLGFYLGAVRYGLTSEDVGNHDAEVFQRGWAAGYNAATLPTEDVVEDWYARQPEGK